MSTLIERRKRSVNKGTDLSRSDEKFPMYKLPDIHDLCEMACRKQEQYPHESELHGATIDVSSAYQQIPASVGSAKNFATIITVGDMLVLVIYLVLMWGYTRAGHIYCVAARAFHCAHNHGQEYTRSLTYIDDAMLIDRAEELEVSESAYVELVEAAFGPGSCQEKKRKKYGPALQAIGWWMDLRYNVWKVAPKKRAMRKLLYMLMVILPKSTKESKEGGYMVRNETLQSIASSLNWYMKAIPLGRAFVRSLFKCIDYSRSFQYVKMDIQARMDLEWLEAVVVVMNLHPHLMAAPIEHLRCHLVPTRWILSDASSTIGGGAHLNDGTSELARGRIRWTKSELEMFRNTGVSINVLEFFAAAYFVMVWADMLAGQVVQLWCDNTSAVAWMQQMRGSAQSLASLPLVRILSVFCFAYQIALCPSHIPGSENTLADLLSRDAFDVLQEEIAIRGEEWWKGLSREDVCRRLLSVAVLSPEMLHMRPLLSLVSGLQGRRGSATANL